MVKIAMWSGPRNLSTAMMYAFGARNDCAIWDEPYYATYLLETGIQHPMQEDIIAKWPNTETQVVEKLVGPNPNNSDIFYQKHMCQHMVPAFDRAWLKQVTNVFLIRHPARVIASYQAKRENPSLDDIGFTQQLELFDQVNAFSDKTPIVIDSADIRAAPKEMLQKLCHAIGIPFDTGMLSWPKGGHPDDGPWARHWYGSVWNSTKFGDAEGPIPQISPELSSVLNAALPIYEKLTPHKITRSDG